MTTAIDGKLLSRNWALNLGGQVLPLFAALITIPYLVSRLGSERFGMLSIAWVVLGFSSILDLGLGRATTKFVAEHLGLGDRDNLPRLLAASLTAQCLLGLAASLLGALAVPMVVDNVLKISPRLLREAKAALFILTGSLPLLVVANTFRGALEAAQRFDLVNSVRAPANIAVFVLPSLAASLGWHLPGMIALLGSLWTAVAVAYLGCCLRVFPFLRASFSLDWKLLPSLIRYGGWVQISNLLNPLLSYLDRIFIASLVSMSALGYYTAAFDGINRAWILPGTLSATLFPAFTALQARGSASRVEELCARACKSVLLALGPALILVIAFAREILQWWLGAEYAAKSAAPLQILAVGMLFNAVAILPFSLLQSIGRPDLTAKFHLLELAPYLAAVYFLVVHWGISGAAGAWTLRVAADCILLIAASVRLKLLSWHVLVEQGIARTLAALCVFAALLFPCVVGQSQLFQLGTASVLLSGLAILAWRFVLDGTERSLIAALAGQLRIARSK